MLLYAIILLHDSTVIFETYLQFRHRRVLNNTTVNFHSNFSQPCFCQLTRFPISTQPCHSFTTDFYNTRIQHFLGYVERHFFHWIGCFDVHVSRQRHAIGREFNNIIGTIKPTIPHHHFPYILSRCINVFIPQRHFIVKHHHSIPQPTWTNLCDRIAASLQVTMFIVTGRISTVAFVF